MRILFKHALPLAMAMSAAWAQNAAPTAAPAKPRPAGYLTAETTPDVQRIVPPAPATGDPRFVADMAIFRATRSLEGSRRWALAQSDDNVSQAGLFSAFSCSLGVTLTRENAPAVANLISRANVDAGRAAGLLKDFYKHKRPFQVEDAPVCLSQQGKTALERSPDYPSGHTAAGWEAGLILAELAPDASTAILNRAMAFGESRIVCGVHNNSAVENGRLTSSLIFAAQNASPEFRADLEKARTELAALRAAPPQEVASCALEKEALPVGPYASGQ